MNFRAKEELEKVGVGATEKFIRENMGTDVSILSLGGTEPDIPVG